MLNAIHLTTDVLSGGRIEISSPDFPVGRTVEVIVNLPGVVAAT